MLDEPKNNILESARSGDVWGLRKALKEAVRSDGTLVIPEGIEVLPAEALTGNLEIRNLIFPSTMKIVGENAFAGCEKLGRVRLNHGLEKIGVAAFRASGLQSVDIPETVKEIGGKAFSQCKELSEITFHNGLKNIGEWAFSGTKIKNAEIPYTVNGIGTCAFVDCKNLGKVRLNNPKADIHPKAFNSSTRLIKAKIVPKEM